MPDQTQNALTNLQDGVRLLDQGQIDEAIGLFDLAIRLDGTLVDAYLRRSEAHNFKGAAGKAVTDATKALMLDAQNAGGIRRPRRRLCQHGQFRARPRRLQ